MSNQSRFHSHPRAFQFIRQLWQWCLFVVLLTAGYHGQGQTYPVQVTTTLLPPYSPELSYYSSADVNNMQVFVHVLELDRVDYRAKLRLTIEGAGVRLTTLPSYVPNPLVLQGGVPLMLSGFDLRHYLNPDHLAFEGMTKADFMRNGRLPEGFYTFTIEVLDYTRGVRVSNASMATAWIVLNDPPLINFPINADKITLSEPQFVNFSWLGRHLASPNAAFSTEYEFSLYEMLPGQTSPDAAVRSSNTIYRTTTTQSSLLYGPAEPLLEPGKKYAFRVQAYDVSGRDLFKNQGYSETYWFQYGDECMPVKFLAGEALDDSRIKVTWESEMSHTGFTLQYREKGKSSWHTEQALFGAQVIPDLQANTEYEYQVAGKCLNYIGDYSTIQTVKTEERASGPEDEGTYACGEEGEASDLNPTPLEKTLRTLDQFEIGGIDVIILEATKGSDGSYTGTGYSPLPIFKGAGLKVSIENVIINEDYKAIAGKVVTTYDEEGSFIFGSHDEREPEGEDVPNGIEDLPTVVVTIPVEIASVTVADGVVTVLDETGTPVSLESTALPAEGNTLTLEDASGDQWLVDSEGNVQKAEPTAASQAAGTAPAAIGADENVDFSITFEAYTEQKFGFDDPKQPFDKTTTGLSAGYTQKQVQEENYWVAWKSVATGQTDWVTATHDAGETLRAYVGFKTTTGELASQPSEQEQSKAITVLGKSNQHTETVTAYVKQEDEEGNETEKTLGVLQVISYDQVRERVIIVPVNDATVPDAYTVGEALNRIYSQAVAHWEVEVSSSYQVEAEILTQLDEGESGILSSFPSNMQGFNRDYKRSLDNYDKDAYYLFLIPGSDSDRAGLSADRAGFMPFKRQFGYIWTDKASNQSTTIAHELGHGAFRLRHTFSTENFVAGERTTDNLMDYNGGTQLYKHQWDFVHDPESMNGWAQDDAESELDLCFWTKSLLTYNSLFGEDHVLKPNMPMYNEVKDNFDSYWDQSAELFKEYRFGNDKENNLALISNSNWTIRNATHYKKTDETFFVDLAIKAIVDRAEGGVTLHKEGVTLAKISLEGKDYKLAAYSNDHTIKPNYVRVDELCDLVDDENVQVYNSDGQSFITFLKEGVPVLVIQILTDDEDDVEVWLKYMGILVEEEGSWTSLVPPFWENWSWAEEDEQTELVNQLLDVSLTDYVDFVGYDSSDPAGCYRRASDMLETAGYAAIGPGHEDVVQMTRADENDDLQVEDNIEDGIDLINEYLNDNIPIMVGVDYHEGHPGNLDETTDHWLVIVGRTTTNGQTCFHYYDAQTSHESIGTSNDNQLCEQDDHTLTDTYREGTAYERTYTVTMVRPSVEIND
ncbi:hypothetical protein SAMN04488028_1164 [Reichenbachiella agariperforans]|uniref:Fibronectin type-III domain-containing protein n=1 Tax=Reichenbachiella agariperforans TaxID=156994 RepID=A0A1M6WWZ4_REIAG|nr:fibronectin type III domain-containing protein [Reichenbachiella agariperforans]SHK98267.1 hypothetical protein SAMN04488028_1164 [Reichenbachiella agariperforans]